MLEISSSRQMLSWLAEQQQDGFDRLYAPQAGYATDDVVNELYDVVALPHMHRPIVLETAEI